MTLRKKIGWYTVKLPFMLMMIITGFILEFIITFPFMVAYHLDRLFSKRKGVANRGKQPARRKVSQGKPDAPTVARSA